MQSKYSKFALGLLKVIRIHYLKSCSDFFLLLLRTFLNKTSSAKIKIPRLKEKITEELQKLEDIMPK